MLEKTKILELAVAKLISEGFTRKHIAKKLELSLPRISQLLDGNPHLVKPMFKPKLGNKKKLETLLSQMDQLLETGELRNSLNAFSPHKNRLRVDVVYDVEKTESRFPTLSNQSALVLSKLLNRSSLVGICGGPTIKPSLDQRSLFNEERTENKLRSIRFIPVCGLTHREPEAIRFSSTNVAMRYQTLVSDGENTSNHSMPNLNCIAHYSPYPSIDSDLEYPLLSAGVLEYLRMHFQEIFDIFDYEGSLQEREYDGGEINLISKMDTVITGVGSSDTKSYSYLHTGSTGDPPLVHCPGYPNLTVDELKTSVISGDISGILLPKDRLDESKHSTALIDTLNCRLTTLTSEHSKSCADRAGSDPTESEVGVVCVAYGKTKAQPLMKAIELGYVNRVIIDLDLAEEMEKEIL